MAGTKSKAKKKAASADELEQEQGEQVSVKELVRDERTHKITATVLLLLSVTLFISYASYLFTWQEDQDKVLKYAQRYLIEDDLQSENLLGRIGAWISHVSFYNGVGIASFLFCSVFFVLGVNLLFAKKIFSFSRTLRYTLMGILILPVAFAFFLQGYSFPWGGAYGNYASGWLAGIIGRAGTAALLFLAAFSYIIWRFNPVFKLPQRTAPVLPQDFPQEEISQPIHFDA
ncbi:MAG: DNA translocase FtsK, partial [Bacteroidetes bacterium]|nr:DNA translocase FtsK [Bacteroidota bacterium]